MSFNPAAAAVPALAVQMKRPRGGPVEPNGIVSNGMVYAPWLAAGPISSGDPAKDSCVARIKAHQRSGEAARQQWWDHCDQHLSGVRDPMRHDRAILESFLNQHNVP